VLDDEPAGGGALAGGTLVSPPAVAYDRRPASRAVDDDGRGATTGRGARAQRARRAALERSDMVREREGAGTG